MISDTTEAAALITRTMIPLRRSTDPRLYGRKLASPLKGKFSLEGIADYIRTHNARNIVFLVGAGISTGYLIFF